MKIGSKTTKNKTTRKRKPPKPEPEPTRKELYAKYLRSPEWIKKRDEYREIFHHQCFFCKSTENLHVHHISYENLGNETVDDLIVLCKACHLNVHKGRMKIWTIEPEHYEHVIASAKEICDPNKDYIIRKRKSG